MATDEAIQNLKDQVERLEKALEAEQSKVQELTTSTETLGTVNKTLEAKGLFVDLGLSPKQAALFVRGLEPGAEVTKEAVLAFAQEYDLSAESSDSGSEGEEGAGQSAPPVGNAPLSTMAQAGSRPGQASQGGAGTGSLTRDEWQALHKENPAAAGEALRQGRVQLREDNFYRQTGLVKSPE